MHENLSVYWFLTYNCNLSCNHCIVDSSPENRQSELSIKEIKNIIRKFSNFPISNIILSGGEPLAHNDILEVLSEIHKINLPYVIETNGLLITQEIIDLLRSHQTTKSCTRLVLSIEGSTAEVHDQIRGKGTFNRLIEKVKLLKQNELSFGVNYTINQTNLNDVENILYWSKEQNLDFLTLGFIIPLGRAEKNIKLLALTKDDIIAVIEKLISFKSTQAKPDNINLKLPPALLPLSHLKELNKKNIRLNTNCDFPRLGITNEGKITLCSLTKNDFNFGNAMDLELSEVIHKLSEIKKDYDSLNLQGVCRECVYKTICKGSCRAFAYQVFGSLDSPHPFCTLMDAN